MLVNVELAAKYVGCSRKTIYNWINWGWIRDHRKKTQKHPRLDTRELDTFKDKKIYSERRKK